MCMCNRTVRAMSSLVIRPHMFSTTRLLRGNSRFRHARVDHRQGRHEMTKEDSSRIQSSQAKGGHDTGKDTFAARAQSAGDRAAHASGGGGGGKHGGK
ncbi:hypothetical protein HXX76_008183 [Chlamydomonas incerta]|uniref:Uncharacterized protein n=1 Tax=Chlamydomonas incerta TaxID=51695 RepID=A0A835W2P9_CHLIN|nr:hypothetical protein HXX76_008183 [Chlamydomonas incerta]|eukprot:KAG2433826.1 hypothetical protein HXX76_008183 [Chlamydomonas incerta]